MKEVTLVFHDTREEDYPTHSGFFIVKFPKGSHCEEKENGYDILYWQHKAKRLRKYSHVDFLWAELPDLGV